MAEENKEQPILSRAERLAIDQAPKPDTGNPDPSKCYGDIELGKPFYRNGRKILKIPISKDKINQKTLEKYLPKILRDHQVNVASYRHLHNVYTGKSNILHKQRPFDGEKENTIIDEKHPWFMVEFKKGFMYGNDVKYSCADAGNCNDEVTELSKYMKKEKKAKKNVEIAEDVYVVGAGNRLILPKRKFKRNDSPFEIFNLDYCSSFVVYSSNYTGDKLFGGVITEKDSVNPEYHSYEIVIYSDNFIYTFDYEHDSVIFKERKTNYLGICNIVEYKTNKSRIGIVELVEPIFDAVNIISSNSVDNIIDFVNSILVIENQKISDAILTAIRKNGALSLQSIDPSRPAKASYLVNSISHEDVSVIKESLKKTAYDIAGVPQPTTKSTSGGDTGQARELGGGYATADIIANQDEIGLKDSEEEMNEICLAICKKNPECPIKELDISDFEINFNRRKNDNLLTKAQSLKYLYDMNMPKEISLNYVGISANSHEDARAWENEDKEAKGNVAELEKAKSIAKSQDESKLQSNPENEEKENE